MSAILLQASSLVTLLAVLVGEVSVFSWTFLLLIAGIFLVETIERNLPYIQKSDRIKSSLGTLRLPFLGDIGFMAKNYHCIHDAFSNIILQREANVLRNTPASSTTDSGSPPVGLFRPGHEHSTAVQWDAAHQIMMAITHPKDLEHILKTNWENYVISQGPRRETLRELLGHGIFAADGKQWYAQRKTVSREFTLNNFRNFMLIEFVSYARQLSDKLQLKAQQQEEDSNNSSSIDLHKEFFKLTLDSFGKVAFGVDLKGLKDTTIPFGKAFDDSQKISIRRFFIPEPVWKLQRALQLTEDERNNVKCLKVIDDFVDELVEARSSMKPEEREEKVDLFSRLFHVSESDPDLKDDAAARAKYLRDMTVNFMIAGRDTTACALSWLVYELIKNPKIEEKLFAEINETFPKLSSQEEEDRFHPSIDSLNSCQYLNAVLYETLRLHPSVPMDPKMCLKDDKLPGSGLPVKAGDTVAFFPYCMGRMVSLWGPSAKDFIPERFVEESSGKFLKPDPFRFPAFQAGPRLCLGIEMALLEMRSVVVMLVRRYKFEFAQGKNFEAKYVVGPVLQMDTTGLPVKVISRK